ANRQRSGAALRQSTCLPRQPDRLWLSSTRSHQDAAMNEQPIQRLNYFNGQRLEAVDFRLEQNFHIGVRRWLNKSPFTPGIAAGLQVLVKSGDPHTVIVQPGLALDALGREIIVVEPREVAVAGKPSKPNEPVVGNYLVIEYAELPVAR